MKAQSGKAGKAGSAKRLTSEKAMGKVAASKKRTLRNEAPGKKPGFKPARKGR